MHKKWEPEMGGGGIGKGEGEVSTDRVNNTAIIIINYKYFLFL